MRNLLIVLIAIVLMGCDDHKIISGNYGGGMLKITAEGPKVKGVLDLTQGEPQVSCYLEFEFSKNTKPTQSVKLIDSFGNKYDGRIEIREKELFIQSLEPLGARQRIIDLERGEKFALDE